jgi:hypothetical protein
MLIKIGPQKEISDIVDLLLECHERIRSFIGLAGRLANCGPVSDTEVSDAAARVVRYFSESLPLHVADEEESILPRLLGRRWRASSSATWTGRKTSSFPPFELYSVSKTGKRCCANFVRGAPLYYDYRRD